MAETGLFYLRYMDDWVVLAPSRWKLRRAVVRVNRCLEDLRLQQHPDKTFVGRVERGFDFVGYQFKVKTTLGRKKTTKGFGGGGLSGHSQPAEEGAAVDTVANALRISLTPSVRTLRNYLDKIARLYEQGADRIRIERYVRDWWLWRGGGMSRFWIFFAEDALTNA